MIQRTKSQRRNGGVLVWLLMSLTVIVGVVAIGLDGGRLLEVRRRAQATADAAALAAAVKLYENYDSERRADDLARTAALEVAEANGSTNNRVNSFVTVNMPPDDGAFAGRSEFVEVVIEARLPRSFSAIFTGEPLKVVGRAVARGRPSPIGLMALKRTGANTFRVRGPGLVTALGSPIIVNSDDPAAFTNAPLSIVTAQSFRFAGGYVDNGIMIGQVQTDMPPVPDPLRYLPAPDLASQPVRSVAQLTLQGLLPTVLQPGIYRGGLVIKGAAIVVLSPGLYILEGGGLEISGLATVTGLGTVFYNTGGAAAAGPIKLATLGRLALTAPTSGVYQGVSIFQDRAVNTPLLIQGAGLAAVAGTVYAPAADLTLRGLAAVGIDSLGGAHVVSTIDIGGIGSVNLSLGSSRPRVPDIRLVE